MSYLDFSETIVVYIFWDLEHNLISFTAPKSPKDFESVLFHINPVLRMGHSLLPIT